MFSSLPRVCTTAHEQRVPCLGSLPDLRPEAPAVPGCCPPCTVAALPTIVHTPCAAGSLLLCATHGRVAILLKAQLLT